jgi:uncharacterized membrane protein YccC
MMAGSGFREWVFSWNCFIAAMLALFISFSIGLERPFWAMTTVYITSQPLSGAVRSKAVFRLIGTIVGGAATVAIVPVLSNAPVLLSLALALWVAGCQFISLLDRTPRSYLFMLAGYTAALIGFPSVAHPELIFDTAVLRVQEIGLGVICAALVHSLIFPRSVSAAIGLRVATLMREADAWIADVLGAEAQGRTDGERRRLAADVTELHALSIHLPFDTARIRPTRAVLATLQDRLVLLLPLVSAVEDRLRTLDTVRSDVAALVAEIRAWVIDRDDPADPERAAALAARCRQAAAATPEHDWDGLLTLNLCARLGELVDALAMTHDLAARVIDPEHVRRDAAPFIPSRVRRLHRDYAVAALSATATMVALLGCCTFWIATGWPEGATATMISAVICCFFATMDDPVPAQRSFLVWTAIAVPITAVYLFAILPMVHNFETLTLVLAPALLVLGLLMALPHWYGKMMPLMIGFGGGLALTNSFSAEAAGFINSNVALLIGTAAAIFATRLMRVIGAGTAIRRLRRAGWRDLGTLAGHAAPALRMAWNSRMLDRVGLLAARIGDEEQQAGDGGDGDAATAALRELRIGAGLIQLDEVGTAAEVRSAVGAHYRARVKGREEQPAPALLAQIDGAISDGFTVADAGDRQRTLSALTALRRNFFPAAPAWVPDRIAA